MRITISNTAHALNIGFDPDALTALLGTNKKIRAQFDKGKNEIFIRSDPKIGRTPYKQNSAYYINILGGLRGLKRHSKIVFGDSDIKRVDGGYLLCLSDILPSATPFIRAKRNIRRDTALPKPPKPKTGANMVMTIGDMTICFNIPSQAALKLAFSLSAKGYMTEGAE